MNPSYAQIAAYAILAAITLALAYLAWEFARDCRNAPLDDDFFSTITTFRDDVGSEQDFELWQAQMEGAL